MTLEGTPENLKKLLDEVFDLNKNSSDDDFGEFFQDDDDEIKVAKEIIGIEETSKKTKIPTKVKESESVKRKKLRKTK